LYSDQYFGGFYTIKPIGYVPGYCNPHWQSTVILRSYPT